MIIEHGILDVKSVAQLLDEAKISKFRKWILKKLIPKNFYDMPAQRVAKLQKGAIIGSLVINAMREVDGDFGYKKPKVTSASKKKPTTKRKAKK